VIIATMYFKSVVEELEKNGFQGEVYSAFHMVFREGQLDYRPLEKHVEDVKGMLADEKSRSIVEFICQHRKVMDIDFSDICERNQYFIDGLVKADPHAVFVDVGAYHGETIEQFISFQKGMFDKVYAFEMDTNNYATLKEKDYDERVELLNYGLWNEKTECRYASDDSSSAIGEGDMVAQCISLDEAVGDGNVTFIKMDIEGAEMNALLGAEKCIKRCKPQLAICVYHKPEDIYDITALIHRWLPEHKLYIRHHSPVFTETVLYAIPDEE
jgi:FkbM family methyltransferase